MIRYLVARFTLIAMGAAACAGSEGTSRTEAADSSIVAARARAEDLANSAQSYQPVRFVSDIEQVNPPLPVVRKRPVDVVRSGRDSVTAEVVMTPVPAAVAEEPVVTAEQPAVVSSAPRVPSIIAREAPVPEAVGGTEARGLGEWRGNDPGPDMGTVIGVVLRGGRVDLGHCPRHPRPPSQIPDRIRR